MWKITIWSDWTMLLQKDTRKVIKKEEKNKIWLHTQSISSRMFLKNKLLNNMDESKYKGQDKYCVYCDTSSEKDYTSVSIITGEKLISQK